MNIPNPKTLYNNFTITRHFEKMGLGQVVNAIQELELEIDTLRQGARHFDTPEWKWMIETLLPQEHIRIAIGRSQIPPDDIGKQAIAQGQINEILHLQEILISGTSTISLLENQLSLARQTEAKLRKRSDKK